MSGQGRDLVEDASRANVLHDSTLAGGHDKGEVGVGLELGARGERALEGGQVDGGHGQGEDEHEDAREHLRW